MGFLAALLWAAVCVSPSEALRADPLRLRRSLAGVRADCPVGFTVPRPHAFGTPLKRPKRRRGDGALNPQAPPLLSPQVGYFI